MSRYTTEVRYICETASGLNESVGCSGVEQVIKNCLPKVFDFSFPIFDESYRSVLETKILRHFYTREIAHETVGLWKLKLSTKLNEIMPLYNQLYKSELLSFNPLYDVDLTRERKVDITGTKDTNIKNNTDVESSADTTRNLDANSNTDSTYTDHGTVSDLGKNKQLYSDTPQGAITDLEAGKYLTNATINDNSNATTSDNNSTNEVSGNNNAEESVNSATNSKTANVSTSNTDITNLENYIETVKGKQGTQNYSELLLKFRETFLNIDMLVINELEELFFGLWA